MKLTKFSLNERVLKQILNDVDLRKKGVKILVLFCQKCLEELSRLNSHLWDQEAYKAQFKFIVGKLEDRDKRMRKRLKRLYQAIKEEDSTLLKQNFQQEKRIEELERQLEMEKAKNTQYDNLFTNHYLNDKHKNN